MASIPTESVSGQGCTVQGLSNSQTMENSALLDDVPQGGGGKSILVDLFSPPSEVFRRPLPKTRYPITLVTGQFSNVQDTRIPAIITRRSYVRKSSNLSNVISASDVTDKNGVGEESKKNNQVGGISAAEQTASEDTFTPFGDKAQILNNPGLLIPFDLYEATPLTYKSSRRLSMPRTADEWSVAVLQQRWYQSIGSKLCVAADEFRNDALRGIEYLEAWSRSIDPKQQIVHRWAMDIMDELEFHISELEKASCHNYDDGSWKYPSAILPELVELLPLPREKRIQYYGQVCVMFEEIARRFNPVLMPCQTHGILGHKCVSQSCAKGMHKSVYISKVLAGYEEFCREIAVDVERHFHDVYSRQELIKIEEDWRDDLESDRIQTEKEEEERSLTLKKKKERLQGDSHRYGFYTGVTLVSNERKYYQRECGESHQENSSIKPFPFQQYSPIDVQKKHRALPPLSILKPSKFDWGDEDEDEITYLPESEAVDSESSVLEDRLRVEDISGSGAYSERDAVVHSENLLKAPDDLRVPESDGGLPKSLLVSLTPVLQQDLNPRDVMDGPTLNCMKDFPDQPKKESKYAISQPDIELRPLKLIEDGRDSGTCKATMLNDQFQPPSEESQSERPGDKVEHENNSAGNDDGSSGALLENAKAVVVRKARALGQWIVDGLG